MLDHVTDHRLFRFTGCKKKSVPGIKTPSAMPSDCACLRSTPQRLSVWIGMTMFGYPKEYAQVLLACQ
jgi:hypothetical protein